MLRNYVIFDLETTGLSPKTEQIIEIAGLKINSKGQTIEHFHKFIKLYKVEEVPVFIQNLTNINEELLIEKGLDVEDVMQDFLEFIDDSILVAQNSKFDMSFLREFYFTNFKMFFNRANIDTINLAKKLRPDESSYKLSELVKYFDVEYDTDSHHRADYDVKITTEIFIKQINELNITSMNELLNANNFVKMSEKQKDYIMILMGKHNLSSHKLDLVSKSDASAVIDYLK